MPVVNVPGIGPVNFPEGMAEDQIKAAAAKLYTQAQQGQIPWTDRPAPIPTSLAANSGPRPPGGYTMQEKGADPGVISKMVNPSPVQKLLQDLLPLGAAAGESPTVRNAVSGATSAATDAAAGPAKTGLGFAGKVLSNYDITKPAKPIGDLMQWLASSKPTPTGPPPRLAGKAPTVTDAINSSLQDLMGQGAPVRTTSAPPQAQTALGKPGVTGSQYDALQGTGAKPYAAPRASTPPAAPKVAPTSSSVAGSADDLAADRLLKGSQRLGKELGVSRETIKNNTPAGPNQLPTGARVRIAQDVGNLKTPQDAAAYLNRAPRNAQAYIKDLYSKFGIRTQ